MNIANYCKTLDEKERHRVCVALKACEEAARRYGASLDELTVPQATEMLISLRYKATTLRALQKHLYGLCLFYGADARTYTAINISEIIEASKQAEDEYIISREDFIDLINKLQNPCDQFLLYAIWSGLDGKGMEEVTLATMEDIDITNKLISVYRIKDNTKIFNRHIHVDDRFIELARNSSEQSIYIKDNGKKMCMGNSMTIIRYDTHEGETYENLLKRRRRTMRQHIDDLTQRNQKEWTFTTVRLSGLINQIVELARQGNVPIDQAMYQPWFMEVVQEYGYADSVTNARMKLKRYLK